MLGIVDGLIAITGQMPVGMTGISGCSMITCAKFDTYKAEQKHTLAILEQLVDGWGYTIGSLTFTVIKDFILYCLWHFPSDSCDCIV